MNPVRLFRLELRRLFRSRLTWLVMLLTLLSPAVGLYLYRPLYSTSATGYVTTTLGAYVANPALTGGLLGAIFFALLTIWELDRVKRGGVDALVHGAVSPLTEAILRVAALLCGSAVTLVLTLLVWLPYTVHAVGTVFDWKSYLLMYLLFQYGALPLAILFSAAVYQLTRRLDLSLVLFGAFAALSLTVWSENWQVSWLNPCVWSVSDAFSNDRLFRSVAYSRLTWLLALAGLWILSYLCIRRYGRGLWGSLAWNLRRIYRPMVAILLLICAGLAYVGQPFLDHSPAEMDYGYLFDVDYLETVTCSSRYTDVHPNPTTGKLYGTAVFQLQNTGEACSIRFLLNPGYQVSSVRANGESVPFTLGKAPVMNERELTVELPAGPDLELSIDYGGFPQEWNLLSSTQGDMEISSQYMALENDVLSPCPYDIWYQGETLPAVLDITLPGPMTPVLFGTGSSRLLQEHPDGTKTWRMEDEGYRMILFVGDYVCEDIPVEAAGLTVHFYYARKHQPVMEAVDAATSIRQVVEYCTEHYGPLSFYGDDSFSLIENRGSGGGYAGDGASLANELDFTIQNLSSGQKGGSPGTVFIHELVHQWWGLGVMFDPMDEESPWSSEGLTTYATYRIVKELYGPEAAQKDFVDQWQEDVDSYYRNFYVRHPEYLDALPEQYRSHITGSLRGVRHYSEMALKILKAEELVGGEAAMDEILRTLFTQEPDPQFPYLTYQNFLDACGLTEEELHLG